MSKILDREERRRSRKDGIGGHGDLVPVLSLLWCSRCIQLVPKEETTLL
jgi:hypothetical protein